MHRPSIGAIYYGSLRRLGITAVRRRMRPAGPVLCYHNVAGPDECRHGEPGLHMPRDRFERQVRWLSAHYDVLPLADFVARATVRSARRPAAAITFDDGYQGVFEHAVPILRALGLPATVFVVADAPDRWPGFWWDQPGIVESLTPDRRRRWLNHLRGDGEAILSEVTPSGNARLPASHHPAGWATIRAQVGNGIDIGMHSATHRSLPMLTDAELGHEVLDSRAVLHRATGVWPEFFAYPYGCWDARAGALVQRGGYRAAFGLDPGRRSAAADRWCLGRINVPGRISDSAFDAWTAGFCH